MTGLRREEAFHRCRRTLRIWPVTGEDLEDSVKVFLNQRLKISKDRIMSLGKFIPTN